MPRKPGPMFDLVVEGLSTGMLTRTIDKFDDITGEAIPIANPPKAPDLAVRAKAKREQALRKAAEQVQRTTMAMNKALSAGMPSQFPSQPFKPFVRRV